MKYIVALLLAFSLAATAYASSLQWEKCCPEAVCGTADCAEMGCLPATTPVLPTPVVTLAVPGQEYDLAVLPLLTLPSSHIDIWTPPD